MHDPAARGQTAVGMPGLLGQGLQGRRRGQRLKCGLAAARLLVRHVQRLADLAVLLPQSAERQALRCVPSRGRFGFDLLVPGRVSRRRCSAAKLRLCHGSIQLRKASGGSEAPSPRDVGRGEVVRVASRNVDASHRCDHGCGCGESRIGSDAQHCVPAHPGLVQVRAAVGLSEQAHAPRQNAAEDASMPRAEGRRVLIHLPKHHPPQRGGSLPRVRPQHRRVLVPRSGCPLDLRALSEMTEQH
mmetsp:Transcript_12848/g.49212  ORF Transcript_12848/g.49212 Transcript_12848/m.49212 type:complete len:243 (-) Transcript_12848:26-754(-)